MEVMEVDESTEAGTHLSTAEAFVEGGIQDSCEAACSICLEEFCDSDPATLTNCKHEFHLQCVLEWCQRSSNCPMCWQSISLQDATSQGLLEAVERERNFSEIPSRNATIFRHPALGDFELRRVTVGTNNTELEERIMRRLASAAAMGRSQHIGRREGHRHRSSAHGRSHFVVLSSDPNAPFARHLSPSLIHSTDENEITAANPSSPIASIRNAVEQHSHFTSTPASDIHAIGNRGASPNYRITSSQSQTSHHTRAGPSDLQALSDSMKSRFNAVSIRCKESITKSTRGWKERWFSRNSSIAHPDSSQANPWQNHERVSYERAPANQE